jgi:D-beta-D-heptose 7-phosphate kinase/D-beta-D-heptose 1-phosphate adenosyltransferase
MNFQNLAVLCLGDLMLDRYLHGDVRRISPEAPVPILNLTETREMLGGVGNCANNIAALGGQSILVGLIGDDSAGLVVRELIGRVPNITPALASTTFRQTICKTRLVAGHQQVVRADDESLRPLLQEEESAILAAIGHHLDSAHCMLLSDYGKGVLSSNVVRYAIDSARARGIPVFVDPKTDDFSRYAGATCITPNLGELARASGMPVDTESQIIAAARQVLSQSQAAAVLVTRSDRGMTLVEADGVIRSLPSRAREVFDVSGAGDTVIATMALSHASGIPLREAMVIANAAAGVAVSKFGTATVSVAEIMGELEAEESGHGELVPGLVSTPRGLQLIAGWKNRGLKVGFTNGCFDIVHPGHIALLKAAAAQCNRLVVALNSDASVRRLKGSTRPVNALAIRAQVISAIRYVDCVVSFDEDTPLELIKAVLPEVLVKGQDYAVDQVVGADVVRQAGGRVFLADIVPGLSTSSIISRVSA